MFLGGLQEVASNLVSDFLRFYGLRKSPPSFLLTRLTAHAKFFRKKTTFAKNLSEWFCSTVIAARFAVIISYVLGINYSFIKSVFLWPVLHICALLGCVSVAKTWWLLIKTIVNYLKKHGLISFGHETGLIRKNKMVWHLQFPLIYGNCTK